MKAQPPLPADKPVSPEVVTGHSSSGRSRRSKVRVFDRKIPDPLSRCSKNCVQNSRSAYRDGRLTGAAPEAARRHEDRFNLGHFVDANDRVAVEILLLDLSVLDRDLSIEGGRKTVGK